MARGPAMTGGMVVGRGKINHSAGCNFVYPGAQHGFNFIGLRDHPLTSYGHHLADAEAADHAASEAAIAFWAEWLVR